MSKYISLLRGINVSGQKKIKMDKLKSLYESFNLKNVQTYIQSGNVVFESDENNISKLSESIETKIHDVLGYEITVLIKRGEDFENIIRNNPFNKKEDLSKLYVTFLQSIPDEELIEAIDSLREGEEKFRINDSVIYVYCPKGYGRTKLKNNFFERKLKVKATTRNGNSVNKLLSMSR